MDPNGEAQYRRPPEKKKLIGKAESPWGGDSYSDISAVIGIWLP